MAKKTTLPKLQQNLKKLSKDLGKAIRKPFREGQKNVRGWLLKEYWQHSLGRKMWEWRQQKWNLKGGPAVKLSPGGQRPSSRPRYPRWSTSNQAWIAYVSVWGLAAKIEKGGRLNHHAKRGDRRSAGRGRGTIVRRRPAFDRVVDSGFDQTVREVSESFGKFIERTL